MEKRGSEIHSVNSGLVWLVHETAHIVSEAPGGEANNIETSRPSASPVKISNFPRPAKSSYIAMMY